MLSLYTAHPRVVAQKAVALASFAADGAVVGRSSERDSKPVSPPVRQPDAAAVALVGVATAAAAAAAAAAIGEC